MRPSALCLVTSVALGLTASSVASAATAAASAQPSARASHSSSPHVKRSAHDGSMTSAASPQVQPYACGAPTLVSSTGGSVSLGVASEHTLTYGVTLDDNCLAPDTGNVVIYLYQDSGADSHLLHATLD